MSAQEPDEVLGELVVHVGVGEAVEIEHDAQVVDDVVEALFARFLQNVDDKAGELFQVPFVSIVVFNSHEDDGSAQVVSVVEHDHFGGIHLLLHVFVRLGAQLVHVELFSPFGVLFETGCT